MWPDDPTYEVLTVLPQRAHSFSVDYWYEQVPFFSFFPKPQRVIGLGKIAHAHTSNPDDTNRPLC